MKRLRHGLAAVLVAAAVVVSAGCATVPADGAAQPARATVPQDPWEAFNRKVFAFNEAIDEVVLK